jgi:DNA-3-methyladenine glycosylase II
MASSRRLGRQIQIAQDAISHLTAADSRLAEIIASVGSYSLKTRRDPFLSLVEAIISQQLAGAVAATIYSRFLGIYNGSPTPTATLATKSAILRKAGLSGKKVEYVKDLAKRVSNNTLDLHALRSLDDEEVIRQLTAIKGIGRWTAEMFLIFCFGRLDILPVGDFGLRKAVQKVYELDDLPAPSVIREIAIPWRPYSTVATWYLWKSLEKFKGIG